MHATARHLLVIFAVAVFVALLYSRVSQAYFCGYDDFIEIHRAAFDEAREPLRILTDTHFNSYKYRPLSHGINFLTYHLSGGDATLFRFRNLAAHLINVALVYGIGLLLFESRFVGGAGALLFGVHPLANQPVVAASFTIVVAHTGVLLSLFCFLFAVRRRGGGLAWLCLALLSGWLAVMTYESSVSVFLLMFAYLFIRFAAARERPVGHRFLLVLTAGTVLLVGSYFGLRQLFVSVGAGRAVPSVTTVVKSTLMYAGALLSPVDSVLAHEWLGTPLPSEIELGRLSEFWWVALLSVVCVAAIGVSLRRRLGERLRASDWPNLLFLALAAALSLLPLIVLTPKPSETYVYLAVAFTALLFGALLETLVAAGRGAAGWRAPAAVVGVLVILFSCATWVRNNRVARCGDTARRIVSGLPAGGWTGGGWAIKLARAPGEPTSRRYGLYGERGVDTIGVTGVQPALQWLSGNESLAAAVVAPESLLTGCAGPREVCLWVHADGRVSQAGQHSSGKVGFAGADGQGF